METGALIRQPHGGAIRNGGPPTALRKTGRPSSEIRNMLRGDLDDYAYVLRDIAGGECVERIEVPLLVLLERAECPECGGKFKALQGVDARKVRIEGKISANPADRRGAVDTMAKYGIGIVKTVSADEVKEQLQAVVETVGSAEFLSVEQRDRLLKRMEKAWKTREVVTADG